MGSEISWCFTHECQVIRAWEHPILSRHLRFLSRAWCEIADFLETNGVEPEECSIGTALITQRGTT